jgi:hypothetical protein
MEVPIQFENVRGSREGLDIERDIALLERMAGRGNFEGAAIGPPPVVRVSTTNSKGEIVPLIPRGYQWSLQNPSAPLWRIAGIDWDTSVPDGVLRNDAGNRIRQKDDRDAAEADRDPPRRPWLATRQTPASSPT